MNTRQLIDDAKRLAELKVKVQAFRDGLRLITWPESLLQEIVNENATETNTRSWSLPEVKEAADNIDTAMQKVLAKIESRESNLFLACHQLDYEANHELDVGELRQRVAQDVAKMALLMDPSDPYSILSELARDANNDAQSVIAQIDVEESARRRDAQPD